VLTGLDWTALHSNETIDAGTANRWLDTDKGAALALAHPHDAKEKMKALSLAALAFTGAPFNPKEPTRVADQAAALPGANEMSFEHLPVSSPQDIEPAVLSTAQPFESSPAGRKLLATGHVYTFQMPDGTSREFAPLPRGCTIEGVTNEHSIYSLQIVAFCTLPDTREVPRDGLLWRVGNNVFVQIHDAGPGANCHDFTLRGEPFDGPAIVTGVEVRNEVCDEDDAEIKSTFQHLIGAITAGVLLTALLLKVREGTQGPDPRAVAPDMEAPADAAQPAAQGPVASVGQEAQALAVNEIELMPVVPEHNSKNAAMYHQL
jgi:hypothetical protein